MSPEAQRISPCQAGSGIDFIAPIIEEALKAGCENSDQINGYLAREVVDLRRENYDWKFQFGCGAPSPTHAKMQWDSLVNEQKDLISRLKSDLDAAIRNLAIDNKNHMELLTALGCGDVSLKTAISRAKNLRTRFAKEEK